jgi:hypothetical protein
VPVCSGASSCIIFNIGQKAEADLGPSRRPSDQHDESPTLV